MKHLKYFKEAEIYIGTLKHLNPLNAVNNKIFDEVPLFNYKCEECYNEFKNKDLKICPVCSSEKIITLPSSF